MRREVQQRALPIGPCEDLERVRQASLHIVTGTANEESVRVRVCACVG